MTVKCNQWNNFNISFTLILFFKRGRWAICPVILHLGYIILWWHYFTSQSGWKLLLSKAALFLFLIFWVYFYIILILWKESFQGISEETCWKLLHWGSWQSGPLLHLSDVEVNSMKLCQEALTEHAFIYPVSVCSSSFLPCQLKNWAKLCYTVRCCMGTTKKAWCPVWRRKCWIRNLECFCGRALSKCRNKSLAADPNPWSLFMEEGRDCSSTFVSLVEPGQGENRYSIQCGASEVVAVPCSSCPQLVWQREQLGAVTVSCLGCEREICNFMAGWLSHHPWGDGKEVRWQQQHTLPDRMFWGGCWTDQTDDPELSLLCVWWWVLRGRTAFLQWTCANDNCTQVKRSVIITNSVTKLTGRR